jgi:signal transduction histidine kinase
MPWPGMKAIPLSILHRLRRSAWALPLAASAAVVLFGINEAAYTRSRLSLANMSARAQAQAEIQRIWQLLLDAESGQRGYLITGRGDYLRPFQAAMAEAPAMLVRLQQHLAADAEAVPLVAEIARHTAGKLSELGTTLKLYDSGPPEAWREVVLTDIGREKMDAFRSAVGRLLALETQRMEAERHDIVSTISLGRIGINLMAALSLLGLFLFLRQTWQFDRAQRRHAQALQEERSRLEREVALRTADLTELARHLQTAREDEKGRLARELHDELGALLTAAKLDSARLKRMMGAVSPDMEARMQHLNESINRGIELKRRIIEDLCPSSLRTVGLMGALEILVREFAARSDAQVHEELAAVELAPGAQITAFRLVQEALTNVAKYAEAQQVTVSLQGAPRDGRDGALISVQDNGRGFDPAVRRGSAHGLMGMRYRVEAEAGRLRLESAPGKGTRIEAWLPAAVPAPDPTAETAVPAVG